MTRTSFSGGAPLISMMKSADLCQLNYSCECGRLNGSRNRRVFVQRQMSAGTSVIVEIGSQDPAQTRFVKDDHVVQAFSPYRPDQPLGIRVLPRRARSARNFLNTQPCGGFSEYVSVITVAIMHQKTRSAVPRERLHKLAGRPLRRRMAGHCKMDWPTTVVSEDDEHKQQPKRSGWNHKEIGRSQILYMIVQEGTPGLRGRRRCRTLYLATAVVSETWMPSLPNSP